MDFLLKKEKEKEHKKEKKQESKILKDQHQENELKVKIPAFFHK